MELNGRAEACPSERSRTLREWLRVAVVQSVGEGKKEAAPAKAADTSEQHGFLYSAGFILGLGLISPFYELATQVRQRVDWAADSVLGHAGGVEADGCAEGYGGWAVWTHRRELRNTLFLA